ncbi:MAG: DUF5518 domain-containing protein [Candidatus Altiarchaeales archaeon]|nr:DUF5518 domain-containing protein [Candidatus Altiarchaeales archaeon]
MISAWKVTISAGVIGILIGILSGLPYLQYPNIFCLWVISGGALSAYLLKRSERIELIDGAFAGAFTGMISIMISAAINLVLLWFRIELPYGTILQLFRDKLLGLEPFSIISLSIVFIVYVLSGIIFGACGGVIGTKITKQNS